MGGRSFGQYNKQPPACVEQLAADVPACFDKDGRTWRLYLMDCWAGRLNDPAARERMRRGERPNYCEECTQGYAARMRVQGRCHPANESGADAIMSCTESAACAAERSAAGRGGSAPQERENPRAQASQVAHAANTQTCCPSPSASCRRGSVHAEEPTHAT